MAAFAGLERLAAIPPFTRHFGGLPGRFKPFAGGSEMATVCRLDESLPVMGIFSQPTPLAKGQARPFICCTRLFLSIYRIMKPCQLVR